MEITRESLQQRYSDLADAELLRRARSGALTELAREVALDELAQRGFTRKMIEATDPVPSVDEELAFAPDEFERNPYQAPRTPEAARAALPPASPRGGFWNVLWWLYIAYLGFLVVFGLSLSAGRGTLTAVNIIHAVLTGLGAVGLSAWRLRRALFHPALWIACLAAGLALLSASLKSLIGLFAAAPASLYYGPFVYVAAVIVALNLPVFWGLTRYAFLSPSIWRRAVRP